MKTINKRLMLIISLLLAVSLLLSPLFTVKADGDELAPVISVTDSTIRTYVGSEPVINVTATDDIDGEIEVVFTWSSNALDQLGTLTNGEHTCTITATDTSNNVATVTITYIVTEDTADNSGYAFVTIICEGMPTVVKAYEINETIDMSAYVDKEGFNKTVKNGKGETITNFTAISDCTLYVTYTENISDAPQNNGTEKSGCNSSVTGSTAFSLLAVLGVSLVRLIKKQGE